MRNMGRIRFDWNPIVPGGLIDRDTRHLELMGWKQGVTEHDIEDVPVGFVDAALPGQITMHNVSIPKGTEYYYDPDTERAIIRGCGNPTCWRYL